VTLLAVISTPTTAHGGGHGGGNGNQNRCCPIDLCIFEGPQAPAPKSGDPQTGASTTARTIQRRDGGGGGGGGQNNNNARGIIQFTKLFAGKIFISGFLEDETAESGNQHPDLDVIVVACNQANNIQNLEGGNSFDVKNNKPFTRVFTNQDVQNFNQLTGQCCVVARDKPNKQHQIIGIAPVKQAVTCRPNVINPVTANLNSHKDNASEQPQQNDGSSDS